MSSHVHAKCQTIKWHCQGQGSVLLTTGIKIGFVFEVLFSTLEYWEIDITWVTSCYIFATQRPRRFCTMLMLLRQRDEFDMNLVMSLSNSWWGPRDKVIHSYSCFSENAGRPPRPLPCLIDGFNLFCITISGVCKRTLKQNAVCQRSFKLRIQTAQMIQMFPKRFDRVRIPQLFWCG